MKSLKEALTEELGKNAAPRNKKELQRIIKDYVRGLKIKPGEEVDLNWINISKVDDLSMLFKDTKYIPIIDKWKINHVKKFEFMFQGNKVIKRSPWPVLASKLPAGECYRYMFFHCAALEEAPELPATTLTPWCYQGMFKGCISLKKAPELPATKLAEGCYCSMFDTCPALQELPELPATKLAPDCYCSMFAACKFETAPELPATKLAKGCYDSMFCLCPNLKLVPALPATVLPDECYIQMFLDCPRLVGFEQELPTPTSVGDKSCFRMFDNTPMDKYKIPDWMDQAKNY